MRDIFARIKKDGGIHIVESDIVPVIEIFRLQDMDAVRKLEVLYLR